MVPRPPEAAAPQPVKTVDKLTKPILKRILIHHIGKQRIGEAGFDESLGGHGFENFLRDLADLQLFLERAELAPFFRCLFRGNRELIGIAGRLHLIPRRAFGRCRHGAQGHGERGCQTQGQQQPQTVLFSSRSLLSECQNGVFQTRKCGVQAALPHLRCVPSQHTHPSFHGDGPVPGLLLTLNHLRGQATLLGTACFKIPVGAACLRSFRGFRDVFSVGRPHKGCTARDPTTQNPKALVLLSLQQKPHEFRFPGIEFHAVPYKFRYIIRADGGLCPALGRYPFVLWNPVRPNDTLAVPLIKRLIKAV